MTEAEVFETTAGEWRVEWFEHDGGAQVSIFAGPRAKERALLFAGVFYCRHHISTNVRPVAIPPPTRLEAALREAREALWMANRDKESVLKRIETEIRSAEALPNTGEINQLLRAGRLGALHTLKETFLAAGWVDPRSAPALDAALAPAAPAEQDEGGER